MVRTKKKLTRIDKSKCSPQNKDNKFTCFTKTSLIKIINSWNKYYKKKISYKKTDTVKILWSKIERNFKKSCDTELCWLNQPVVKDIMDEELKNTFKPKMPNKWNNNKTQENLGILVKALKPGQERRIDLPTIGPKTISGLILEKLESFPDANVSLSLGNYQFEVLELQGNVVKSTKGWQKISTH